MKKWIILVVFVITGMSTILSASERDGNGWQTLTRQEKSIYVSGLYDGIDTGLRLGTEGINDKDCLKKVAESFFKNHDKYIVGTINSQIMDGVDNFYDDVKNRKIPVRRAFFVVLMQIARDSDEVINKEIITLRKGLY